MTNIIAMKQKTLLNHTLNCLYLLDSNSLQIIKNELPDIIESLKRVENKNGA